MGGEIVNKIHKKVLLIIVGIIVALIFMHLSINYLVPFVKTMHSGMY
jgi:hypothetical protein